MTKFTTDPHTGLTAVQVAESRRLHGINVLTPKEKPSLWRKFLGCFADPLIRILLVALGLSFAIAIWEYMGDMRSLDVFLEPCGILMAVLLATMIGFFLEVSAEKKFEILNAVNDDITVKVRRDGRVVQVPRRDIVVGDIVILDSGDEVPADGRLVDSLGLAINESTLTGEPRVRKSHLAEKADPEATYPTGEALRGTTVIEGRAMMEVTAVGDATEYGKVFEAAKIDSGVVTPLTLQMRRLGRLISLLSYAVGALIVVGRTAIFDFGGATAIETINYCVTTIMLAITLIVVSVPEGLPMSVTLSLALSMRRMLATNNLVRKLHACETMGSATVICTDKTGTLTQNRMEVWQADIYLPDTPQSSTMIAEGIALNTTAYLDYGDGSDEQRVNVIGNPTDGALLLWLRKRGSDYLKIREEVAVTDRIPFSSERKFMASVVDSAALGRRMLYVKGAPEIIVAMCKGLDEATSKEIAAKLADYQNKAMRTLAMACATVPDDCDNAIADGRINVDGLTLCTIFAINDPVRTDVPQALADCHGAGIDVKIITGDNAGTAREIGRQTGLWTDADGDDAIITGPEWAALSDEEAHRRAQGIKIISRARPADKSRMVKVLQDLGHVVAVTGDGTNDAPALNAAHVGLAMGDGTSVAKEAGDIIILDNSFASITKAVMWGRSLYQNIQRFILFQLTVNLVACFIVVIGAFTGTQSPLSVTQMLWVNLIMDTFAALALASLPPSPDVMHRKPRPQSDFIITPAMTRTIMFTGVLFTALLYTFLQYLRIAPIENLSQFDFSVYLSSIFNMSASYMTDYDLTLFFTAFVAVQVWNLLNARCFGSRRPFWQDWRHSRVFFATVAVIIVGQIIIVYVGGDMMNVVPVAPRDMLILFAVTSPIALIPTLLRLILK